MSLSVSEATVFGSITFVNCTKGCPSQLKSKGKPCQIHEIPMGIQFSWRGQTFQLIGTAEFEVLFLRNGQVKIILCENAHCCRPRTYAAAIAEKHLGVIRELLDQGIDPVEEDVQLARAQGLNELADILSERIKLEGFELVPFNNP